MTKWKIVTDTGSDIRVLDNLGPDLEYEYVPLILTIDGADYIDDENLDMAHFEHQLGHTKQKTQSACPAPDRYQQAFEGADNIICFTLSSALSGSYNAANLAKDLVLEERPNTNIYIFDSHSAGSEMNLLIYKAVELIHAGLDFAEVVDELTQYHQHTNVIFILKSVKNLVNNGRVNRLVGQMVGLLKIFLIGERTPDGKIDIADRARGERKANRVALENLKKKGYNGGRIELSHASNLAGAEALAEVIKSEFPEAALTILPMSALCTFYAELEGIIIGFETN